MPTDDNKPKAAIPVSPLMALGYAVNAALNEMVVKGVITEDAMHQIENRSDELIMGLFRGEVLTAGPDGLYTLTPRTDEQKKQYPVPGETSDDDGALVIGD